jgi:translocation and assembly module TamB
MDDLGAQQQEATETIVRRRRGWGRIASIAVLALLVLVAVALIVLWTQRRPIAENYIENELERRGVKATYRLDRVGLRTQQVSNLVIGDPRDPDLTARFAQIQMRIGLTGSVSVYRIVARGARLKGRVLPAGKVSWGQIDKLLPPPSGKPFRLPNVAVEIADSSVALATPAGPIGMAIEGTGNLVNGFSGKMAVASPRLVPGRCELLKLRAAVAVEIVNRRPHVVGPLAADRLACPQSQIAIDGMRFDIDSRFSEAFESFDGNGRLAIARAVAGANAIARVNGRIGFEGTPTAARGAIDIAAQQARLDRIVADRTHLKGRYFLGAQTGQMALVADYDASSVALAPTMMADVTAPLLAAKETPVGPIAAAIGENVRRAGSRFDASGSLRLVNFPGGGAIRIERADVHSASGARVQVSGGDGVTYYWPSYSLRIDGLIEMAGGGLPSARIRLSQPRGGGPMSGTAQVAAMRAGNTRLALAPVRFRAGPDSSTRIETVALLDGPIPGGMVRGLRLPIEVSVGGPGGFRFGQRCLEARFARFAMGSLQLGAARLPVCPEGPAMIVQRPGGAIQVSARVAPLRLAGTLGESPVSIAASALRLLSERFAAAQFAMRLGRSESPVVIEAARLEGGYSGSGTFGGASATIGRVPLLLSEAGGTWRMADGGVAIAGGLTLSDRADPPKFYPLRSDDVRFTLADDMIRATGSLRHPASGTRVSDVTITHRLSTGAGEAILDVPGIRFGEALQPEELTRLTEGVIALVVGEVRGQGRIAWTGAGEVTSTGEFSTDDLDLAAAFGPITGMQGTIHFTDLLNFQTAPGQTLRLASVNPGILVENGVITYELLPDQLVRIQQGRWPFMGGELILHETIINFGKPSPKRLTFEVVGLDSKLLIESFGFKEFQATGIYDGVLPMIFDEAGGRIVGGRLDARPGGGTIAYNGVVSRAQLGMMGEMAFNALRNLRYRQMTVRLDGDLAGEFVTRLTIDRVALGNTREARLLRAINRVPFKFNVTIKGPFRALIATAKSFRDPTVMISDVMPRPLDEIPGLTTETRRLDTDQSQSQTPVDQQVDVTTTPPAQSETKQ